MIDIASWPPDVLRRLNLRLFEDPAYQYDLDSLAGYAPEEVIHRRIKNMKDERIQRLLSAVPPCPIGDEQGLRDWWAVWMPIAAGMQLWPDGNHRTGMLVAELVAEEAGFTIVLDEEAIDDLRRRSKALVKERWSRGPEVIPAEFTDPAQPLRQFYEAAKSQLQLEPRASNAF